MIYYHDKINDVYMITEVPITFNGDVEEVTEEEYLVAITPTEEEIRAQKEEELHRLLRELYPQEEEGTANEEK